MGKCMNRGEKNALHGTGMGILLIGLGVLFLLDLDILPWILVVFGLAGLPSSIAEKGFWAGLQGLIWAVGLAILLKTGEFWPGILILIGASILAGSFARPPMLEKSKPKRGLPDSA